MMRVWYHDTCGVYEGRSVGGVMRVWYHDSCGVYEGRSVGG